MDTLTTPSRTVTDRTYSLTYTGGLPTGCTCPGYGFRGTCRHITERTNGGFEVYCDGCGFVHLRAVRYDAGRTWQRSQTGCSCCGRQGTLCVVPDWDARDARRDREIADEATTVGLYVEVDEHGSTWLADASHGHADDEAVLHYKWARLDSVVAKPVRTGDEAVLRMLLASVVVAGRDMDNARHASWRHFQEAINGLSDTIDVAADYLA